LITSIKTSVVTTVELQYYELIEPGKPNRSDNHKHIGICIAVNILRSMTTHFCTYTCYYWNSGVHI